MARFAAFLRGMNLGKRRITRESLVRCFEDLGMGEVSAFLASGNVAVEASGNAASVAKRIERGLSQAWQYEVPTFVRSAHAVCDIAATTPFEGRTGGDARGKLQVAMLRDKPSTTALRALRGFDTDDDWLTVIGDLYWWPRGGVSQSELDLKGIEKSLGIMTIRTRRTIERMADRYFTPGG